MADSERSPRAGLSKRGQQLVEASPTPEYLRAHFERNELLYDAVARPDGYIPLCVAENALVFDVLRAKMDQCRDVTAPWLGYQSMTGAPRFKEQLARFMRRKILGREVRPEHVAALAGRGLRPRDPVLRHRRRRRRGARAHAKLRRLLARSRDAR